MPQSALDFCSQAVIRCHANPIASFDEGTTPATVAANLYPAIRDDLLASYPWNFTTAVAALARLAAAPAAEFAHAFQLPPNLMSALAAGATAARPRGLVYEIHENRLHCDSEVCYLKYHFRPAPELFPPHFAAALIAELAAQFCGPVSGNLSLAGLLAERAERALARARAVDARQDAPNRFEDFALVDCRA